MATLNQIAESIAISYGKEFDEVYMDSLKFRIKIYRSKFIKDSLDKGTLNGIDLQAMTIKMKQIETFDDCVPNINCTFLRSVNKIPKPIRWNANSPFKFVGTADRYKIFVYTSPEFMNYMSSSQFTGKSTIYYSVINNYLVILNNSIIDFVTLEHYFNNPEEVVSFCNNTECYNDDMEFPCPEDILMYIIRSIREEERNIVPNIEVTHEQPSDK
jgi:hypothetical protein